MNIQLCGIFFSDYPIDRWLFCVLSTSTVMPRVQSILRNNVDRCEALKIEQTIYFKMTVISKTYTLVKSHHNVTKSPCWWGKTEIRAKTLTEAA